MSAANGTRSRKRQRASSSGNDVKKIEATPAAYDAAVKAEAEIAELAAAIREDATELDAALFLKLAPLLRVPIPEGFLIEATAGTGKPYASKGIRSVQVCVDRMDAVLTPLWWHYEHAYEQDGKLCLVTVNIGALGGPVLVSRSSYGGMNRGSTEGNLFKGTFTNAAKRAFALVGVGASVYTGATDYEPDVDPAAAREQAQPTRSQQEAAEGEPISDEKARELVDAAWIIGQQDNLGKAVGHVLGTEVGDLSNKTAATAAMRSLTAMQAAKVERWLNRKADTDASDDEIRRLADEINGAKP